jgi:hypothetical protein
MSSLFSQPVLLHVEKSAIDLIGSFETHLHRMRRVGLAYPALSELTFIPHLMPLHLHPLTTFQSPCHHHSQHLLKPVIYGWSLDLHHVARLQSQHIYQSH